jgi:hypothetical protein
MLGLYPGHDWDMLTNDAVTAVELFMASRHGPVEQDATSDQG